MLVLASNSPRRRELLSLLGIPFAVQSAAVDETPLPDEHPAAYVERLACGKAWQAAAQWKEEAFFLAADTTVAIEVEAGNWQIFGKPQDSREAEWMLRRLRGRKHFVYTGLALLHNLSGRLWRDVCVSEVSLRNFSDEEMRAYIASGDPFDKAGAYAIQHEGFHPVENFADCYANVMGLPLCRVTRLLASAGIQVKKNLPIQCVRLLAYPCSLNFIDCSPQED